MHVFLIELGQVVVLSYIAFHVCQLRKFLASRYGLCHLFFCSFGKCALRARVFKALDFQELEASLVAENRKLTPVLALRLQGGVSFESLSMVSLCRFHDRALESSRALTEQLLAKGQMSEMNLKILPHLLATVFYTGRRV